MKYTYCPCCGEKLVRKEFGSEIDIPYCVRCKEYIFELPYPCFVTLVVNEKDEVAVIKQECVSRSNYGTVIGYVHSGEIVEDAVAREVEEELGLEIIETRYLKSYYYQKKDALFLGFISFVDKIEFSLSEEIAMAKWINMEEALEVLETDDLTRHLLEDYLGKE